MRALGRAREAAERAQQARDRALAGETSLRARLQQLQAGAARTTAGSLGRRDAFAAALRGQLLAASERTRSAERALREAARAVTAAQGQVERALRAREAAEAQRDAEDKAEARRRERRDQAASDDGWRPPRR